jgi:integrase
MLRVSYARTKTFVVQARNEDGKRKKKTLGIFNSSNTGDGLMLAHARAAAQIFKGEYAYGRDVVSENRNDKKERRDAPIIADIIDLYIDQHVSKLKPGTRYQATCILTGSKLRQRTGRGPLVVKEELGDILLRDLKRRDVARFLERIEKPYSANRTHEIINHMLKWAIRKSVDEDVDYSVADLWERHPETVRDRWLADAEIKKVWAVLDDVLVEDNALIYRLLLATGQREIEVLTMKWADLDFDKGEWIIPAPKTKSYRVQLVPMTDLFRRLLKGRNKASEWVFPSPGYKGRYSKTGHRTGNALTNVHGDVIAAAGVEHFRFHDLRRSAATHMSELGVDELVVCKVLNHASRGITGQVYNHHSYRAEKHRALSAWAYKLEWLAGQALSPDDLSRLYGWGFASLWKERPWRLNQWASDQDNVVAFDKGAAS